MEPIVRPARKEDCGAIAALYSISSDGVADYIWMRLGYREVAREAIVPHPLID